MGKLTLYFVLVISYLGLSSSSAIRERGNYYLVDESMLSTLFEDSPICVILVGQFSTGYFFKTYFHQYKITYGFRAPEFLVVKTSKEFARKHENNLGMSLFRRSAHNEVESTVPMPPGALFVGNLAYGSWVMADSGQREWEFHRPYQHLIHDFGWGSFRPDFQFHQKMKLFLQQGTTYYGPKQEFGTNGSVSKGVIEANASGRRKYQFSFTKLLAKWSTLAPYKEKI